MLFLFYVLIITYILYEFYCFIFSWGGYPVKITSGGVVIIIIFERFLTMKMYY